ncbi:hypothetical protein FM21_15860 [Streptomyces mutabilis]|uniref:Transposase n=1 Tax=Streptomyces mutabilis TaxID=67332 RepID=A0A086N8H0_9ACTN|nr:hypothetical protein FM21_15860 [Streptomyces mutabilis]
MRANGRTTEAGTASTRMEATFDTDRVGVFLGLDVGNSNQGHGPTPAGKKVFDKALPNVEPQLRAVFDQLEAKFGTGLAIQAAPCARRPTRSTQPTVLAQNVSFLWRNSSPHGRVRVPRQSS